MEIKNRKMTEETALKPFLRIQFTVSACMLTNIRLFSRVNSQIQIVTETRKTHVFNVFECSHSLIIDGVEFTCQLEVSQLRPE